ncbi:LysR substrate-binding domain-containing protein [Alteromonas sp. KUL49]|uniref:LysR substrate-binding domain-containing protein n=1 Tax=Alteromonas sp. KUL49 TaxID=2480798 RepID=UPI00102EE5BF|nr:LysR substrate-binding domain-containing protein [Alteromonas sp. KUL49]TAP34474.1 LysR family transcriptional regulator [Alteromonas sp. KUL49]GEA13522.1 LysR family transcriptional regulator [Alteromonas sp. KUL49]
MIDLNDYYYFVHVVEKRGFTPAANALNMPKSRLSRHVSKLEERLDTKLIQRTSRQFNVTETGQIFYQHARALLDEMEAAEAAIESRKTSLTGRVSLSCSLGVAHYAIQDLVIKFMQEHPDVELVQQVTNQNVDMVSTGVDMAIRGHTDSLPDSSIIQRSLSTFSWYLFASPAYLANAGNPTTPYDLYKRQSLKLGWQPTSGHWTLQNQDGVKTTIPFTPQLCSDDMSTLIKAAVEGMGIVSLPAYTCKKELSNGSLQRVLPTWISGKAQLSLLTPSRRTQSPVAKAFADYLIEHLNTITQD